VFAWKVAKPQTKVAGNSASKPPSHCAPLLRHRPRNDMVERTPFLQQTIGNQARLRFLGRQDSVPPGNGHNGDDGQQSVKESKPVKPTARGLSWDFSKIPLFPPERASRVWPSFPSAATPILGSIQARLVVGEVNDPLEHEADRVADEVMRMPAGALSASPPRLMRKCATCEEEERNGAGTPDKCPECPTKATDALPTVLRRQPAPAPAPAPTTTASAGPAITEAATEAAPAKGTDTLQRQNSGRSGDQLGDASAPDSVHGVLRDHGEALDPGTRDFMEARFGQDFRAVRIHRDTKAAASAHGVGARAYTVGDHIAFAGGAYQPASSDGRRLLAHELAHVVQQRCGAGTGRLQRDAPTTSVQPTETCPTPKGKGNHPTEVSQTLIDRMMGKYAAKDGDPGEGCIPYPYPAGNGETVCTIGFGHQIRDCPTINKATGNPPTAAEIADANTAKKRDGDGPDGKPRVLRPSEWLTCQCAGKKFDCTGGEAENTLRADARIKADYIHQNVPVDLDQAQFDALVDLALHHGSIEPSLLKAIKDYWCTAQGRNYVRDLYLQTDITAPGGKKVVKGFVNRRQLRVWPLE
jgi:GH24 family phage-related lysozyme (muramidase)